MMNKSHINTAIKISNYTLIVFYTQSKCWQFRVISNDSVFSSSNIYYTAEAAEAAGRKWVVGR
ncbi:MAG: hypothetical protein AAGG00_08830 [Cyanobacteria bacterium P01_H01_bin.150]